MPWAQTVLRLLPSGKVALCVHKAGSGRRSGIPHWDSRGLFGGLNFKARLRGALEITDLQLAGHGNFPSHYTIAGLNTSDPTPQMKAERHQIICINFKTGHLAPQSPRQRT